MRPTKYIFLPCLLLQVSSLLSIASVGKASLNIAPPNFADILRKAANVSSVASVDDALIKLTDEQLYTNPSFINALVEIGVVQPSMLRVLSSIKLTDGSTAFNLKATTKKIAETGAGGTASDLLKIVIDSIKISKHGENIDYKALGSNPYLASANLPIPYPMLSTLVNVKGVMKAISLKEFISGYIMSYEIDQNTLLQNYIDYSELLRQLKLETLAKNPLIKSFVVGFGIPEKLIDIVANIDSNKLTKAVNFDKIAKAAFKYNNGNQTQADLLKLTKTILGNINYKEVVNQLNINKIIGLALNQTAIADRLDKMGIPTTLLKRVLLNVDINDILRVINFGNIMDFNGTLSQLPRFILNHIDLNNILPDINLENIMKIPQINAILNQTNIDPKLVKTIIESLDLNKFFKAFNFPGLIRDLRRNTDQDYVKVVLNNTNVDTLILSIDVDKLFSHPAVGKFIKEKFKMDPMIAKLLLKNVKVDQLLKAIDTKAISKMLVNSVNGTMQSIVMKVIDMVNFDKIIESVDINKFLDSDKVKEMLKNYGIDPILLEIVASLELDEILKSLKIEDIIKQALLTGNFDVKDIMQQMMKRVDITKILGKLNWKKLVEKASKGKLTSLPVSLECGAEIGKIAASMNMTGKGIQQILENPFLKMFDAWGKPQTRLAFGNLFWLGAVDECKTIPTAKYCISTVKLAKAPIPFLYGSCIPKRCSERDFQVILEFVGAILVQTLSSFKINIPLKTVELSSVNCEPNQTSYSKGFIITLAITAVFVVLAIFGSILESFENSSSEKKPSPPTLEVKVLENLELSNSTSQTTLYRNDGDDEIKDGTDTEKEIGSAKQPKDSTNHPIKEFLLCFSISKNMKTILSTSSPKGAIKSINGMRVISITWVIIGHIYMALEQFPIDNGLEAKKVFNEYAFLPILNGHVSVDTFFLLSGLLVSYLTMKQMKKTDGKINVPMFYLHRFLRLTPVYMFALLIWTNVVPYLLFGPIRVLKPAITFQENCYDYWWSNLLYINNFYPTWDNMCMTWSWYLANDMQFYVLAPLILIVMYKLQNKRRSTYGPFIFIGILCAISMLITAILIGVFDLAMVNSETRVEGNPRTKNGGTDSVYVKPYTRIVPYLIGLLLGYVLVNDMSSLAKHRRRKIINIIGWVISFLVAYAIVYGPAKTYKDPPEFLTSGEELLYGTFFRFLWSLCIAWVIFSCQYKLGGPINSFLSWSGWIPLCRLSYGAYLIHPFPVAQFQGAFDNPLHYQDGLWVYYIIALVVMTFAASFLLALFVEFPIMNLEKMLMGGGQKKKSEK